MNDAILRRIQELVAQGKVVGREQEHSYNVFDNTAAQAWLTSAANAVQQIAPPGGYHQLEIKRLCERAAAENSVHASTIQKAHGVLQSVLEEASSGLLVKLEYQVFATAFDDFLDHAAEFHRSGKAREAAVLASAVLEDAIKRIAIKSGITVERATLEPLIDELTKAGIFTTVKAKRVKAFAGVRNAALHAEWDALDLKDIGNAIEGTRELLDNYL